MKKTESSSFSPFVLMLSGALLLAVCFIGWHYIITGTAAEGAKPDTKPTNGQQASSKPPDTIIRIVSAGNQDKDVTGGDNKKIVKKTGNNQVASNNAARDNLSAYINVPASGKMAISVVIVDDGGAITNPVSSAIANVYTQSHQTAGIGLIKNSFVKTPEFKQLFDGDSNVIEKLNLAQFTNYLGIGKIVYSYRKGTLASGTTVCNAALNMNIISAKDKTITQSFTITNANGNGVTESQAKDDAFQKLLNIYSTDHVSL